VENLVGRMRPGLAPVLRGVLRALNAIVPSTPSVSPTSGPGVFPVGDAQKAYREGVSTVRQETRKMSKARAGRGVGAGTCERKRDTVALTTYHCHTAAH
jgi:hypothetical protein